MSVSGVAEGSEADLNLWLGRAGLVDYPGAEQFLELVAVLRSVQGLVAGSRPSVEAVGAALVSLRDVESALADFAVDEPEQVSARLLNDPGRGQALVPPLTVHSWDTAHVRGSVRFGRFHLGSNGAVHGGAISLLFDDLLGQLANPPGQPRARTAWIRVDYHRITPLDRDLTITADVVERDGRKMVIGGGLRDGDELLASAQGLFVQLRSHQP
jgi:acyl-coenzyme A thioesterase PaaI-like protein